MNAERLLAHYERIADAPDAIDRLRRFILDLAVRGKLVPQDPKDEAALVLLKLIAAEKARLVKAGEIKEAKPISLPKGTAATVPAGWQIVPLGEIINSHLGGGTPSKNNHAYWGGNIRWASVKDIGKAKYLNETIDRITEQGLKNSSSNLIAEGNLIVVTRMGLGQLSINRVPVAINQDLRALFLSRFVSIDFVYNFFLTYGMEGTGLTVKGIKIEELLGIPFPLPPLAEQHRIVAKVDELMALCDRLETARAEREATRDRLVAASLARLNAPDPGTFQADARFVLNALPAMTTRPDQFKQLRLTILNLAVRGKLVPQDPKDEALRLPPLRQFAAASGMDNKVFEQFRGSMVLPSGWQIAPLAQLSENIVDCPHTTPEWTESGEICIRTNQIRPRALDLSKPRYVSQEAYLERIERLEPKVDDILYTREGGILGIACRVPPGIRLCLGQRLMLIRAGTETRADFLEIVLNSPFITDIAKARTTGGAAPRVNMSTVRAYPVPLPPLAEQHRIVAKVDDLMTLCDRLEANLTAAADTRRRLLDALLAEALAPAKARELEAAA